MGAPVRAQGIRYINDYMVVCTSFACPEQYDVFYKGETVGYLRLRHGYFDASYPDVGGEIVYEVSGVKGDGRFDTDEERNEQLTKAVEAIDLHRRATS